MNRIIARLWLWFWHLVPANPILVRVVTGNTWEMTFTPHVGNDMASISDYISVETI